jgi:hypothetical protein
MALSAVTEARTVWRIAMLRLDAAELFVELERRDRERENRRTRGELKGLAAGLRASITGEPQRKSEGFKFAGESRDEA